MVNEWNVCDFRIIWSFDWYFADFSKTNRKN